MKIVVCDDNLNIISEIQEPNIDLSLALQQYHKGLKKLPTIIFSVRSFTASLNPISNA